MQRAKAWYLQLNWFVKWVLRVAFALVLTYALLDSYDAIFHPPVPTFPYVVGIFAVIVCTIVLGAWPGMISLVASVSFFWYAIQPNPSSIQVALLGLYIVEGLALFFLQYWRQRIVQKREQELAKLKQGYEQLIKTGQSKEQMRETNQIMLKIVEGILNEPGTRKRRPHTDRQLPR